MASTIDPTKPTDGVPAVKSDLRANLQAAKDEIEALQAAEVPAGGTTGQRLTKLSATDFDTGWQTPSASANSTPVGFVTPEDYGAAGDGSTDNATAFDTMCAALSSGGADVDKGLWLPPDSVYRTSGSHEITSRNNLVIMGNNAIIRRHSSLSLVGKSSYHLLMFEACNRLRVNDLRMNGDRDIVTPVDEFDHLVKIKGPMTDFAFANCMFMDATGDCVDMKSGGDGAAHNDPANHPRGGVFAGCIFRHAYRNCFTIDYGHEIKFLGCEFSAAEGADPQAGFDAEPISSTLGAPTMGASDLSFEGCLIKDNQGCGLEFVSSGSSLNWIIRDITVSGCHFINNGIDNVGGLIATCAIRINGEGVVIVGNTFRDHVTAPTAESANNKPLIVSNAGPGETSSRQNIITNNRMLNNSGCTHILGSNRSLGTVSGDDRDMWIEFSHNFVDARSGLATGHSANNEDNTPAIISWQYNELRAVGNTFLGDGNITGVRLVTTSANPAAAECTVDDNRMDGFSVGIRNEGVQRSIRDQIFTNVTTPSAGGGSATRT